ncbi:MAG: NAD(P)-binding protein, partial [Paracoccaceae bacterium]
MLDQSASTPAAETTRWIAAVTHAVENGDEAAFRAQFCEDAHWRDLLAFTWQLKTISPPQDALGALWKALQGLSNLSLANDRTAPQNTARAGRECLEAFLDFESPAGHCTGVVRLLPFTDGPRAWTLMTALDEIHHHPEITGQERPKGDSYSRDFRGPNWLDLRASDVAYKDRDPAVIVVGGGQAGLAIAARLRHLGVDTLIVDREARIGDNWRLRYHALTLHNQVQVNHMPYMPFPASWPTYIPKDKLANWFEAYVEAMELNFWTSTDFLGGNYDEAAGRWDVTLRLADGSDRVMHPNHVVMATGVSGIPNMPDIATLDQFAGPVMH